jgi:hypothetical protein
MRIPRSRAVRPVPLFALVLAAPSCDRREETVDTEAFATQGDETTATTATTSGNDAQDEDAGAGEHASGDDDDTAGSATGVNDGGTGAALPEFLCESRSECLLHSDCCSCVALHEDQEVPSCADETCMRGTCEAWGIERFLCSHTCHIELVECDATMVTCSDAPPDCEPGFVPSLDERCWSQHCVPEALCRPIQ